MEPVLTPDQEAKVKALVLAGYSMDFALMAVLLLDLNDHLSWIADRIDAIPASG